MATNFVPHARASRSALPRHGRVAQRPAMSTSDGLSDRERATRAQRWRETGGRLPSRSEALRLMELADARGDQALLTLPE